MTAHVFRTAAVLLEARADITCIDIPIGLTTGSPRRCDEEARRLLGARRSSVFPAPPRSTLTITDYHLACRASSAACGKKLSKQTFELLPKIRAVDEILTAQAAERTGIYEVHPEVCFYFWNDERPMAHAKRSGFGFMERYDLVRQVFGTAPRDIRQTFSSADVADDDILDALAALWTARRIHAGTSRAIPGVVEKDSCGLPMQLHA